MSGRTMGRVAAVAVAGGFLFLLCAAASGSGYPPQLIRRTTPSSDTRVGLDLAAPAASAGVVIFVDALQQAPPWQSTSPLVTDEEGDVMRLAPGQVAQTRIGEGLAYPPGDYTLMYEGTGSFSMSGARLVLAKPGELVVHFDRIPASGVVLQLTGVDPHDYTRDIRLILPGFAATYQAHPFYPAFIASLERFDAIRFAGWAGGDSNAMSATWARHPDLGSFTQSAAAGVAPEYQIALANATADDPWFTIPVGATDYYVEQFTQLVRTSLDPRLHPIFEYGADVLDPGSADNRYAQMAAANTGLGPGPQGAVAWYERRSTHVFSILEHTYGFDFWRTTRVVSGSLANGLPGAASGDRALLSDPGVRQFANAFAIRLPVQAPFGSEQSASLSAAIAQTTALARAFGLPLFAYGGSAGQLALWHAAGGALFAVDAGAVQDPRQLAALAAYAAADPSPHLVTASAGFASSPHALGPNVVPSAGTIVPRFPLPVLPHPPGAHGSPLPSPSPTSLDVTTYHNDNMRTGWNPNETVLTTTSVASTSFGLIGQMLVDGTVLAQPLFVRQYQVPGQGVHDLVIVATENNSVYAFDAATFQLVWHVNLGTAVSGVKLGCGDTPQSGISSTPVISRTAAGAGTVYVVDSTQPQDGTFLLQLHALDLGTGQDQTPPVLVDPTAILSNGSPISLDPETQYNRTALFMAGGDVYVGAGSHCDNQATAITGWLLRYSPSLQLIDQFDTDDDSSGDSLASIWMSGYASAVDWQGNIYFATGNGAFDANDGGLNYGQSVVKITPDLSTVLGFFTPQDFAYLNSQDLDLGSGGVMLIPESNALVARGKDGRLFLLNTGDLGGLQPGDAGAMQIINDAHGTWGGPAFFRGPNGTEYVYTQGDSEALASYAFGGASLVLSSTAADSGGYGGSSPVVSSNGSQVGTGIVWVCQRGTTVTLEAYDATNLAHKLFKSGAGTWSNPEKNAFVSPLVAEGRVYVGASGSVDVFGIGTKIARARTGGAPVPAAYAHRLTGVVLGVKGDRLVLRLRTGRTIAVDISTARTSHRTGLLPLHEPVTVYGSLGTDGVFHVTSVGHAAPSAQDWPEDR
ncbi:MAG TPA: hypothetical protein VEJ41_04415 [Candidatus Acidoferrales bacterium]|nr:hypothetical protein [Candidatus Acidoferrales bacterium]